MAATGNVNVDHLANEIDKVITRFSSEYDITYAEVIGVLHTKATILILEARERDKEEEDEDA